MFGKPIGANQGVQFPIARSYAHVEAAAQMRNTAAEKFDRGEKCGAEANMAKLLASEAAWEAANACLDAHGGYGFAREYDVERKFRETRLYMTAPDQQQSRSRLSRPERARHAEILLARIAMKSRARLLRSWMFVPGDRQRMIDKALSLHVDAIMMDIEDGVAPIAKAECAPADRRFTGECFGDR